MDTRPSAGTGLSMRTLHQLDPRIAIPTYERGALRRGIVHLGVGGFHRAHQAVYLDDLCAKGVTDWSITGAGVLPARCRDGRGAEAAGLPLHPGHPRSTATGVRVIGSIVEYVLGTPDLEPLVDADGRPETRIVSLTITEGGYPVDEATGAFLAPPPDALPAAFVALGPSAEGDDATAARRLHRAQLRQHHGQRRDGPDGHPGRLRHGRSPGSRPGSAQHVAFPNGMVDRITPQTADADREFLRTQYGLADRWPVVAETFIQWVIEDEFPYGRPPYEDAGVLLTTDVRPYETLKLRILNAGHSTHDVHGRPRGPRLHPRDHGRPAAWRGTCSASTTTR